MKIWKRGREGGPFEVREGSGGIGEGFEHWGRTGVGGAEGEKGGIRVWMNQF